MPTPGGKVTCGDFRAPSPIFQPLPPENPAAFDPLAGMSLDQIKRSAQNLTPEAARVLSGLDIQFHNLYPGMTLNGATAVTSVTIQNGMCIKDLWVRIVLPAQMTGEAKLAHVFKSPSSVVDRLHDWIKFSFPAVGSTAVAGVGLDGFEEGVYPFTWVVGQKKTTLMTQDGFLAVGACACTLSASSSPVLQSLPPENPAAFDPLAGMSLAQIKSVAQNSTPEAEQVLSALDIQFHNLTPSMPLNGATVATSVTIQSSVCLGDVWARIVMPVQMTGEAKFAHAFKSPSSVLDRLHDWVEFPFPAVGGTAIAGVGLDGFEEGVYPFTWVVGQGKSALMSQGGFLTVGACSCTSSPSSSPVLQSLPPEDPTASDPLAGMSLDQIKSAAQSLTPEAEQMLSGLDIQFHNLYPAMTLGGPTAATSITIQSSMCIGDVWARIIMPAQMTGEAKFAHVIKSPSSVVDRLHDWIKFPFPAVGSTAVAGVGLDGFEEGVYPFTWIVRQGKTTLMTQGGFLAVGVCSCGGPCPTATPPPSALPTPTPGPTPTPSFTPTPTPVPVQDCIQHAPERVDVLMGSEQTVYREIEFANVCQDTLMLDLGFSSLVSEIYLAGGHDPIALSPGERQIIRLYFTTGITVPTTSTELIATVGGVEVARIPLSIGPGSAILASASLSELDGGNLLLGEIKSFAGTIRNNSDIRLLIVATIPVTASTWLSVMDSPPSGNLTALDGRQPQWELGPGEEGTIYFVLQSLEEFTAKASVTLESRYGDRVQVPVSARFGPYADLAVSGSALPTEMSPGDTITVTVTVSNLGPSDVPTVTVPIAVTGDADVTSVIVGFGVASAQGKLVVCDAPELLAGGSITAAVRLEAVDVEPALHSQSAPLAAVLQAEVSSSTYDPNSRNNVWIGIWGGSHVYLPLAMQNWHGPPSYLYLPLMMRN